MAVTAARLPGITFETRTPPVQSPLPRMDIAGFVGFAAAGPINVPVAVEEPARFHDIFREDLILARDDRSRQPVYAELPAAVRAFFRNGGVRCWIVRVAGKEAVENRFVLPGLLTAVPSLPGVGAALAFARSPGSWSDGLLANTSLGLTPLIVSATSVPPGFTVSGVQSGDLLRLEYGGDIVAFQPVPDDRRRRAPREVAVPQASHWFRRAVRADVDTTPASPPDPIAWLPPPTAVRWLIGETPDPSLPFARWGVSDTRFIVEMDRADLRGVQPGSWLLVETAAAPPDATPFLLFQVDLIQSADPASSGEPVRITATRAWWVLDAAATALAVQSLAPRVSLVTFELWVRDPARGTPRLPDLGFTVPHPRYFGHVPNDELVYRRDPQRPARIEHVPVPLRDAVLKPRFPLATLKPDSDFVNRPLFLPLGILGAAREDFFQPALAQTATPQMRDGLTALTSSLFLDAQLARVRATTLMTEAFQIQYVDAYGDPWQALGRPLTGLHAFLPVQEVSMIAVPDALQRRWYEEVSEIVPLEAPTLIEVSVADCDVHVEWAAVDTSPPEQGVTYTVQASFDPRFRVIARTWTVSELFLDHDACIFEGCAAPVFYRVRALSPTRGTGPWSNTLWVVLPASAFGRCPDDQPAAPSPITVKEERGRLVVDWGAIPGADVAYTLQRAADPEFVSASVVYTGPQRAYEVLRGAEPVVYFRVAASVGGSWSPWSITVRAGVLESTASVVEPPADYADGLLLDVQTAAVRMCAARGDLHTVLGLPVHFRDDSANSYALRLSQALSDDSPLVLSYAALFHPWVVVRETSGRADLSTFPIAPDGPVCGAIARRTLRNGAWYSPANQFFTGAIDLRPALGEAALRMLDARVNPIWQQPQGFAAVDALTLHPGDEYGELHVRRLMILLRRLVAREGPAMVFRPNDDSLRRMVQREFEQVLGDLFVNGAFAGVEHEEGYRVVADSSLNPVQSIDQGRFIVELRVAPSHPLMFLTVRLVQEGGTLRTVEGA
jgi:hypothetical protein